MLEALGIDSTTERVYRAMLRHPDLAVDRLATHLSLAQPAVRGAVDRLCRLALVKPTSAGTVPVRPDVALPALLTRRLAELAERQREVTRSKSALATFVAEYSAGRRPAAEPSRDAANQCCAHPPEVGTAPNGSRAEETVSDEDRAILRCLSTGMKDEAVARHVGVSVRTLRRQIAALMDRLGAQSRFEAGVRAAERNWL